MGNDNDDEKFDGHESEFFLKKGNRWMHLKRMEQLIQRVVIWVKTQRRLGSYLIGIFVATLTILIYGSSQWNYRSGTALRSRVEYSPVTGKAAPVIYAFFEDLSNIYGTEMFGKVTTDNDREILKVWKESWLAMGYVPKILTLEDAKRHPDYEWISDTLDNNVPLGTNIAYDKACYLRWLAIAAVGGGIISDFDTVPLVGPQSEDFLMPKKFTLYQSYVTSLMKGTAEQYTAVVHSILEYVLDPKQSRFFLLSDMMGLKEIIQMPEKQHMFDVQDPYLVADGKRVLELTDRTYSNRDCFYFSKLKAVHFHSGCSKLRNSIVSELLKDSLYQSSRAAFMAKWPPYYKKNCKKVLGSAAS